MVAYFHVVVLGEDYEGDHHGEGRCVGVLVVGLHGEGHHVEVLEGNHNVEVVVLHVVASGLAVVLPHEGEHVDEVHFAALVVGLC